VHVPSVPASAHDLQVAVQVVAQQMFCAQMPLAQSPFAPQVLPLGRFTQTPMTQTLGDTQSVSTLQVLRHAPVPHTNGSHIDVVAVWQVPVPLQVRPDVNVEPVQAAAAQLVPAAYRRQAPAPLQVPSLPQVDAAAIGHCDAVTGALPAAIGVHVPMLVAIAQDMQVPAHMLLQQTPSTQNPDAQSVPTPDGQSPPIGILPQLMFTQELPDTQSAAAVVHDVLQAAVPHR